MSIDARLNWIRMFLKGLNSPLSDFRPFGIAWAFFRAIAAVENEIEATSEEMRKELNWQTATGAALESLASLQGLFRTQPTQSVGKVLCYYPYRQIVTPDMVFSTFNQEVQLAPIHEVFIGQVEKAVSFRSLTRGSISNIAPGTLLRSNGLAQGRFVVGETRNGSDPTGSFSGGFDMESDASLRQRMRRVLIGDSTAILQSALQQRFQGQFFQIVDATPVPGYFTVFSFNQDETFLREVEGFIRAMKPLGTAFILKPVQRQSVDIVLSGVSLTDALTLLNQYFNGFLVGQPLEPNFLMEFLGSRARLVAPLTRVVPRGDAILILGGVKIAQ